MGEREREKEGERERERQREKEGEKKGNTTLVIFLPKATRVRIVPHFDFYAR